MVPSSGGGPLRMPLGEHGAGPFQNVRIPGIDMDGDGQSLVRDASGRSFAVPARMGLSSSMELPGMSLQENPGFSSSAPSELRCLMSSEVLSLDDSLHQDSAFTFESMDAPSPEAGEPQQFSETLNSLLGAYSLRGADSGSGMGESASDGSRSSMGGMELVTKYAPVDGTQSASALTRNVSRRSKAELSYAELLADPQLTSPKGFSTAEGAPSATVSELSPSTPMQRSPSSASVAGNTSRAAASESDVRPLRKKRVSDTEAEPEAEGPVIPSIVEVERMLEAQQRLVYSQLDDLQKLIAVQYSLTGINPLSQEMAISVLGSEAVKKPKPSLVPEAVRLLRDVYAFKDSITRREARDLSVLTGATFAQIMDFFSTQQSRVKRIYQLAQDEAGRGGLKNAVEQSHVPDVNAVVASADSFEKLLELMRSETSFTGQSRVIQIILDAEHVPFLRTFLEKGGLRILGKWLMQAVSEEQTTLVRDILKALFHLPMVHALPAHVSPVFTTVSKLRSYFAADVAGNARTLVTRWNKQFLRKAADQPSSDKTEVVTGASQDGSKSNSPEKKKLKTDPAPVAPRPSIPKPPVSISNMPNLKGLDNSEKPPTTNLTVRKPMEDPAVVQANKKRLADLGKEKRKVLLVEEMGATGRRVRDSDGRKSSVADKGSRPLSADDIQKAKMRQRLLQGAPNAKFRNKEVFPNISSMGRSPADNTVTDTNARQGSPRLPEVSKPVASPSQGAPTLPLQGQPLQTQPSQVQGQPAAAQVEYQPAQAQMPQLPFQAPLQASQGEVPQVQPVQFQTAQLQALQMHLQTSAVQLQFPASSSRPAEFSQATLREDSARNMRDRAAAGEADSATRGADAGEGPCSLDAAPNVLIAELIKRAIPWTVPPEALVDPEWKVAAGEESREREVQTMRVKREVEESYTDAESIPKDPKEPWEEEQEYDESLTPQVPIDSDDGQDKDADEEHMETTTVAPAPPVPSLPKSAPGHDPQLLALLLRNPELVTELTSGKGIQSLTSLQQKPLPPPPPPPPPPPAIDPTQLQQTLQGFGMPQAFQQQQQQQQYGGYRDATSTSNEYPQGAQYFAHAGLGSRDGFLGPSSNSSSSSSSGSWAASSYFNKQQQQQQQQGYYGGGNQQVWNNRVSNNNLPFAHQQQQHQQHPHPHHVHPPHHQSMDMRNNNHPLDASSRYQHHRAPHQQWYNGPPTRPPTGW